VPAPHAAHLLVTYKCNLKCTGCGSWEVEEHNDLSAEEWRGVPRQLTSLDIVKVLGGEPFYRKDIVEILRAVREIVDPYILQVTTNGMLTDRVVEAVHAIAWPGLHLRISVDGLPKTHDAMRGVPGSSVKVLETVRQVAALRERYGMKFGINFALTDASVGELDDMVQFAADHGADLIPGVNVDPFLVGTVPPEVKRPEVIMITDKLRALDILRDSRMGTRRELPETSRSSRAESSRTCSTCCRTAASCDAGWTIGPSATSETSRSTRSGMASGSRNFGSAWTTARAACRPACRSSAEPTAAAC
jgi:MoaA/NifB/PqqE/SkfB family radical SAM enzyme